MRSWVGEEYRKVTSPWSLAIYQIVVKTVIIEKRIKVWVLVFQITFCKTLKGDQLPAERWCMGDELRWAP